MPVTPDLLYLPVRGTDTTDVLFPWEQSATLRERLEGHAAACPSCTRQSLPIFGASMTRTIVEAACAEGTRLADEMRAACATLRARGRATTV